MPKNRNPFSEEIASVLTRPLDEIEFSVRTSNCLKENGILVYGELVRTTEGTLRTNSKVTDRVITEIKTVLAKDGYQLGQNISLLLTPEEYMGYKLIVSSTTERHVEALKRSKTSSRQDLSRKEKTSKAETGLDAASFRALAKAISEVVENWPDAEFRNKQLALLREVETLKS